MYCMYINFSSLWDNYGCYVCVCMYCMYVCMYGLMCLSVEELPHREALGGVLDDRAGDLFRRAGGRHGPGG